MKSEFMHEDISMADISGTIKQEMKNEGFYKKLVYNEAPPDLTEEELNAIIDEMNKTVENEQDYYSIYEQYLTENLPICPYCNSVLTYFDNNLYCEAKQCLNLQFKVPISHIDNIAWQMKNINDAHTQSECGNRLEFLISPTNPDLLFADCAKCKYLNFVKLI